MSLSASLIASVVILMGLLFLPIAAQCPPVSAPCICTPSVYEPVSILCDNAASLADVLAAISVARNARIDGLVITNTPINVLPPFAFQGFTITRLRLNRNQLTQVDGQAFNGTMLDSLAELDFRENVLGGVPQQGLTALRNLRKLVLSRNRIAVLPQRAFVGYASRASLEKLDLSGNELSELGLNVFSGLSNLKEISLERNSFAFVPSAALYEQRGLLENLNLGINQITDLPVSALDFPNLRSLSLEYSQLRFIQPEAFRPLRNLLYLYVGGNRFTQFDPEMFRYITQLQILGIGANQFQVMPENAFIYIPNLKRLEMSEAAVNDIQPGTFQRIPTVEAIVMNKNQLRRIRVDMFQGLRNLYSLDLKGNKLVDVENGAWANLPALRHLDISTNELEELFPQTFENTLLQTGDRRSLFLYENPWTCDARLDWLRAWLRQNLDMVIDTSLSRAACREPSWLMNLPLRQLDPVTVVPTIPPDDKAAFNFLWLIVLGIILGILLVSICLLSLVRWCISRRRKKEKDQEEEERILRSSMVSVYQRSGITPIAYPGSVIDLALSPATSYDMETARPNYYRL